MTPGPVSAESARVEALRRLLALAPHPEGGFYSEVFRAQATVRPADGRGDRAALTAIYFLLVAGAPSRWHRVASDEVWHYYEGDPLELLWLDPDRSTLHRHLLGPVHERQRPLHTVPAGSWQAAHTTGAYTLAGCTVGPGFDFADFELLADRPDAAGDLQARFPELAAFL